MEGKGPGEGCRGRVREGRVERDMKRKGREGKKGMMKEW